MDEIRQKYIKINKQIFNQRDGEVLQMQKEYGITYKKSWGVPIISLENIAKEHQPSHEVAKLLWEFGGREQTLMAAMLEEPEKVEQSELESYLTKTETPELWEQITRQLLRSLPEIECFLNDWLEGENEVLHTYSVLTLGYLPQIFTAELLQRIMQLDVKVGSYLEKCLQRVLLKVGARDKEVFELLKSNEIMQEKYAGSLAEIAEFHT